MLQYPTTLLAPAFDLCSVDLEKADWPKSTAVKNIRTLAANL